LSRILVGTEEVCVSSCDPWTLSVVTELKDHQLGGTLIQLQHLK